MDLLAWLQNLPEYPKIYWKEKNSAKSFAAAGIASPSSTSYGWRHFSPTQAPHWADFPSNFSFSPLLTKQSQTPSSLPWTKPQILHSTFIPDELHFHELVKNTLQAIQQEHLKKCVFAREHLLHLQSPIDPWPLLSALQKKVQNAYLICIQPTPRSTFISFTPEKLFSRKNLSLSTEALAGTQTTSSPHRLSLAKYQQEFHLVEASIKEALTPLTSSPLTFSPPSLRTTSGLQHLHSHLKATLLPHVTDNHLLNALHPTAALLGSPKPEAWKHLAQEPFERGLYGAPLGRITSSSSIWVVGIRSCLLFESTARLYSGAGIVSGSDPATEWEELNDKLQLWKELLF